jgi:hypothetical protein
MRHVDAERRQHNRQSLEAIRRMLDDEYGERPADREPDTAAACMRWARRQRTILFVGIVSICGGLVLGVAGLRLARPLLSGVTVATPSYGTSSDLPPNPATSSASSAAPRSETEATANYDDRGGRDRGVLVAALSGWLAATNAGDIEKQMAFYPNRVPVFYLARNVSREDVRAEKSRVFGTASVIDLRASEPAISLGADRRTATMRFRKQYEIRGARINRVGEVVQELRWENSRDGWKIVGERDLRVLR